MLRAHCFHLKDFLLHHLRLCRTSNGLSIRDLYSYFIIKTLTFSNPVMGMVVERPSVLEVSLRLIAQFLMILPYQSRYSSPHIYPYICLVIRTLRGSPQLSVLIIIYFYINSQFYIAVAVRATASSSVPFAATSEPDDLVKDVAKSAVLIA